MGQPKNDYFYGGTDLFGIAAAYAFHIAEAQAFLELHGIDTTCEWSVLYNAMIGIAEKRIDKAGLAARFREVFA